MGHGRQVTFTTFVATAQARMSSVTDLVSRMQGKYDEVLDYFGEDPGMAYDVFFKTLHVFVGAFEHARKEVDDAKRQEVPRLPLPLPLLYHRCYRGWQLPTSPLLRLHVLTLLLPLPSPLQPPPQELKRKRALADEERKKMIKGKKSVGFGPGAVAGGAAGGGGTKAAEGAGDGGGRPRARTTGSDERPGSATAAEGAAPGPRGRRHSAHMESDSGRGTFDQTAALMLSRVASIRR